MIIGNYSSTNLRLGYNADYSWLQGHGCRPLYINYLGNNVVFNLRGGNVGIGTAAPEGKLHIVNGDGTGVSSLVIGPYDSSNLRFGYNLGYTWLQANGGRPLYINELGKMNKLLLKKVEELTLHLIAQNEKISRQESAQAELRKLFLKMSKEIKRSRKPL